MGPAELNFFYLDHLLRVEGIGEGVLATAIERCGIYGFDRYGRFDHYEAGSEPGKQALDALAAQYASCMFPADQLAINSNAWGEVYVRFGWPLDKRPNFEALERSAASVPAPRRVVGPAMREENSDLRIIGALLEFIKGKLGTEKHPHFETEAELIALIASKMDGYEGCKPRTLQQRFARAKQLLSSLDG